VGMMISLGGAAGSLVYGLIASRWAARRGWGGVAF